MEASLTCPGGIADAERFFEGLLSGNPKPSEDGSKLLQVVHGADGRKHQVGCTPAALSASLTDQCTVPSVPMPSTIGVNSAII